MSPNPQSAITNSRPEAAGARGSGAGRGATGREGHVLIAGAGIGGLACALLLARRGFSSTILERAPKLSEIGAGIQISPNASHLLLELGLGAQLAEYAVAPEALLLRAGRSGKILQRMELGAAAVARYGSPYWVVHRTDLQNVLAAAVEAEPACRIALGAQLKSFESNSEQVVVTVNDRDTYSGSALVGADGVRSSVRRLLLGDGEPEFSGYIAWRGTMAADAVPEELAGRESGLWIGPGAHLAHFPLRSGRIVNVVAIVSSDALAPDWGESCELGALDPFFAGWAEPARYLIAGVGQWLRWPLFDRAPASRWSRGRVTLLGDAAHPALPFIAQDGATAIEDAAVLARALAAAPDNIAGALHSYEEARKGRTAQMQRQSRRNGRIFHMSSPVNLLRDWRLSSMSPESFAERQDWIYGWRADA